MMNSVVGFIGLGIMGRPMAKNLLNKGCHLLVYDLDRDAVDALVQAGAKAGSPAEIGQACELVFTILPTGAIVRDVLFGKQGVIQAMQPGSLIVDMSSVTPVDSRDCQQQLALNQIGFLDAPVSGGEPKAIDGTLAFMVGGNPADFEKAKPFLLKMGASAQLIGDCGSGSITKLANQIIVNLTIAAVSEALVFATKAGVDPEKLYQAIRGGLAGSAVLDAKAPMIIRRDFQPGGKISINMKDIKNVMATAQELDIPLPMSCQLLEVMKYLKINGHLDEDHSGIVHYFEAIAGVEVHKPETELED